MLKLNNTSLVTQASQWLNFVELQQSNFGEVDKHFQTSKQLEMFEILEMLEMRLDKPDISMEKSFPKLQSDTHQFSVVTHFAVP